MSMIEYNKYHRMKTTKRTLRNMFTVAAIATSLIVGSQTAFAQSYVPVQDDQLHSDVDSFKSDFNKYVSDLFQKWDNTFGASTPDGTTDSLRDLISGSNPRAPGNDQGCAQGDNLREIKDNSTNALAAYAYGAGSTDQTTWGPWKFASASSSGALPEGIAGATDNSGPYVQVNYSHSLRCLLEEQVEWQKLSISIQIHTLLKNYISDAQNAQLTKQLKNRLTAANLTFAKGGNVVDNNGVISSAPVYATNYNQNLYNVSDRQLEAISDQAAADPASGDPQGSLGICQPWRIDVAADMVRNNRTKVSDPYKYTDTYTKCNLADPADPDSPFATEGAFQNFSDNFNDPANTQGGLYTFNHMLSNPQDTPIGSLTLLDTAASDRIARQEQSTKAEAANSGFIPTKACTGDPSDPHCLDTEATSINPGGQNEGNITNLTEQMNNEITTESLDSQNANSTEASPTDINTNTGLAGANTVPLETSGTAVNNLVQEFYDSIQYGYFGINLDTTKWAQGTMLMIYDEMKFSQDLSAGGGGTVVTNGTAPVDTGY